MIDKKIVDYNERLLSAWLRFSAGCSNPDYFGCQKGHLGLELQQVASEYAKLLLWFKGQKFKTYLELGIGRGGSFLLNVLFQPELSYSVAVDNSEYWEEEQKENIEQKIAQLSAADFNVKFFPKSTDDFFLENENKYDCIFIDADHSYEGVKKDYDNALKVLSPNGYLIFHDIVSPGCPGVVKLWREIQSPSDLTFTAPNTKCGIGIHQIKTQELLYDFGVCIIETRAKKGLTELIDNIYTHIEQKTPMLIFHSEDNAYEVQAAKEKGYKVKGIVISSNMDVNMYNTMLTSTSFWQQIPFKKVLIAQTDARLLRKGVDEFMQYDFVGAPHTFCEWTANGGLSLRDVVLMKHICTTHVYDSSTCGNEDIFFTNIMYKEKEGNLAPREVNSKFSAESIFSLGTFGVHAAKKYLTSEQYEQVINQYI